MTGDLLIGLDLGTTRVKGLLITAGGRQLGQAERPTPWRHADGGTEADPLLLAAAGVAVAVELAGLAKRLGARVAGVGLTGMGEAGVLVDAANRPLNPVIAWHDPRGDHAAIEAAIGRDVFQQGTGMHLDAQPSLSKIQWLVRTRPGCGQAVRFHSVPEWVLLALGGRPVSELSLASRTGLLSLTDRSPWQPAGTLVGRSLLADLILAGEPAGLAGEGAGIPGLPGPSPAELPAELAGAALTVAGHDHQTAALALGAGRDGTLLDSIGTAEAMVRCVRAPLDPAAVGRLADRRVSVGWSVVPDHYTVLHGLLTGMTLERLAPMLGATDREGRRALGQAALLVDTGSEHRQLLRELDGQVFVGPLTEGLSPAAVWAAAVQQTADQADRAIDLIDSEVGPHRDVVLTGGWLRNPAVLAAKRARYGAFVSSGLDDAMNEAGAVGAGYLAGVAAGLLTRPPVDGLPHWQPTRSEQWQREESR
jgi:sugar (pentulose or hexulose) kinase